MIWIDERGCGSAGVTSVSEFYTDGVRHMQYPHNPLVIYDDTGDYRENLDDMRPEVDFVVVHGGCRDFGRFESRGQPFNVQDGELLLDITAGKLTSRGGAWRAVVKVEFDTQHDVSSVRVLDSIGGISLPGSNS